MSYSIPLQGLSLGEHRYRFELGDDLFRLHETSPLLSGTGSAEVLLRVTSGYMELEASIEAEVEVECDRCLDPYLQPIAFEGGTLVRRGEEPEGEEEQDVLWIPEGAAELDLTQWLYESVVLSLPVQRVHPNRADCNAEVTNYIHE